jgi:hypothetical protein
MRFVILTMAMLFMVSDLDAKDPDGPVPEKAVIEGSWGRLECIRRFDTIYLPGNKARSQLDDLPPEVARSFGATPIGSQFAKPQHPNCHICDIEVFDSKGVKLAAIDQEFTYLIQGKPQQVTVRSSNSKVAKVVSHEECEIAMPGKATITVGLAGESTTFPVDVLRSNIHERMTSVQAVKAGGKPSLRYKGYHSSNYTVGDSLVLHPGATEIETWRWERQPELCVEIEVGTKGNIVKTVRSAKFPTEAEIKNIREKGFLIEDNRTIKPAAKTDK